MAIASEFNAKNIDELKELNKLTGQEMTIMSYNKEETRKVTVDTLVGFIAGALGRQATFSTGQSNSPLVGGYVQFIPAGEEIPEEQRVPGCFYLEETHQTSIRTQINIPTSVRVSKVLGLKRV